jgi:ATPase subunit of ABC transporter with duplicated ATPase domains
LTRISYSDRLAKRNKKLGNAPAADEHSDEAEQRQEQHENTSTSSTPGMSEATVLTTVTTHHHDEQMRLHSKEVSVRGLTLQFGDLTLLENGYLHLVPGHRYALHAENGAGKTTLLRHIAAGKIAGFPLSLRTVLVEQEARGDERTAVDIVLAGDRRAVELRAQILALESSQVDGKFTALQGERYAQLVDELALVVDEKQEQRARAEQVLRAVGFTDKLLKQKSEELSGGWKMRTSLAVALFERPDLLLLDEPTNHLDIVGIRWLEQFLVSPECDNLIVIVVSHDRTFVDNVATDVVLLAGRKLTYFPGNFSAFEEARADQLAQAQRKSDIDAKKTAHLEQQLARARSQASQSSGRGGGSNAVKAVKTKLDRVGQFTNARDFNQTWRTVRKELWAYGEAANVSWRVDAATLQDRQNLNVLFADPDPLGVQRALLTLSEVSFHYPQERTLFTGVNMSIELSSRIAVVGANGQGKSTLLRVLAGQLAPTKGSRDAVHSARIVYYGQHQSDNYDLTISPLSELKRQFPAATEPELRGQLGAMGLGGKLAVMPIGTLSGGQKCRLSLAALAMAKPHVMLLDEPTQHLSYTSIEALLEGLEAFKGAIVCVSHDRWFIEQLRVNELWLAKGGSIQRSETW